MSDVFIKSLSESECKLVTEYGIIQEISDKFRFFVDGYKFHPKFKMGVWSGEIKLINNNGVFPKGLVPAVSDRLNEMGYTTEVDESFRRFLEVVPFDHTELGLPFEPYDYQIDAVKLALKKKRATLISATGSGKSLIIYMIVRALLEGNRIMIVVPTVMLVTQLSKDFADYGFDIEQYVHTISSGVSKVTRKPITITTWQSIFRIQEQEWWEQWDVVIGDEVHGFKATSLSSIMKRCTNAFYRYGLTGTLDGIISNELTITGHFGPIKHVSKTSELIDRGILSKLKIHCLMLNWPTEITSVIGKLPYKDEIDVIIANKQRNEMIAQLAKRKKQNTLVLFRYVSKHGKPLYEMIKEMCPEKQVFFVSGGVDKEDKENIRNLAERYSDCIIVASYGTMSTGVNIKNIHNIIFASPYKSKTTVIQSIGRGLRLHKDKDVMNLYDFGDDMRKTKKSAPNFALNHFIERCKHYQKENHDFNITEIDL